MTAQGAYNHAAAWQVARTSVAAEFGLGFETVEDEVEAGFDAAGDYYRAIIDRMLEIEETFMGRLRDIHQQLRAADRGPLGVHDKEVRDATAALFELLGLDGAE
jgi:hypothetical protein